MLAIVGSALLVLYVFLPEFLFTILAFNFRAVTRAQRGRFGEFLSGAASSLLPFLVAWFASRSFWLVGHWPFAVPQNVAAKDADYRTVINSLYSEAFFHEHLDAAWLPGTTSGSISCGFCSGCTSPCCCRSCAWCC